MGPGEEAAALPFTEEAKRFVEERGHSLDELVAGDEFVGVREVAKERVLASLRGEGERPTLAPGSVETEALSYPLARVMVSCLGDRYLVRSFSESEAERCRRFVEENGDAASRLRRMGYSAEHDEISVGDYLRLSPGLMGDEWRLPNRRVESGRVSLGDDDVLELFGQAARERIEENLPLDVSGGVCETLSDYLEPVEVELENRSRAREELELDESCFPPCIDLMLRKIEDGEGLPHTARFAVTAFLRVVGVEVDEIVEMFDTFPDFDEEKTRYQVEHISGDSSGTEYTPPSCGTMRTYGNCPESLRDEMCEADTVTHPLSYYRWALKRRED